MRGAAAVVLALLLAGCTIPWRESPPPEDAAPATTTPSPTSTPSPAATTPQVPAPRVTTTPLHTPPSTPPPTNATPTPEPPGPPTQEPALANQTASNETSSNETPLAAAEAPTTFTLRPGRDAPDGTFLLSWTRTLDGQGFEAQLGAVPGATVRIDSIARVASTGGDLPIYVNATPVTDPAVLDAHLLVDAGGVQHASLNLRGAAPSLHFTLAPGVTYDLAWRWTLAESAGNAVVTGVTVSQG